MIGCIKSSYVRLSVGCPWFGILRLSGREKDGSYKELKRVSAVNVRGRQARLIPVSLVTLSLDDLSLTMKCDITVYTVPQSLKDLLIDTDSEREKERMEDGGERERESEG